MSRVSSFDQPESALVPASPAGAARTAAAHTAAAHTAAAHTAAARTAAAHTAESAARPEQTKPTHPMTRRRLFEFGAAGLGSMVLAACAGPAVKQGAGTGQASGLGPGPGESTGSGSANGGPGQSGAAPASQSGAAASSGGSGNAYTGVTPAKTVEFWSDHPGGSNALETELVNAYNASQKETTVKLVTAGKNYAEIAQRFQTALASNQVPTMVMVSDVWWFSYVLGENLVPIEPLAAAAGLDTSDYVTTFYDDYLYKSNHWAVPYARSTPLFYYNKSHFAKAGLPDRAPKTWDEMADFGKKLMAADLGTEAAYNWAIPTNYLSWLDENKVWGWGGDYSDKWDLAPLTGSGTLASLDWGAKTMKSHGGWAGMTSNSQTNDLAAGTISACVDSTGAIGHLTADTKSPMGAGFLPGGPKATDNVCPTGGAGIAISKKAGPEAQLAAIKFLAWLTNAENTIKFCAVTGYLPVRKSADTASLIAKTPLVKVSLDQLDHLRSQAWGRVFITGADLVLGNAIGSVLVKNADPKTAMAGAQKQLQQTFDQEIKPRLG